ncbi:MAG: glycosyltransferase family 2 protein [Armatimonadota bacterium]|jgi:glycosyltransferase involved in cell wall biosynthesis
MTLSVIVPVYNERDTILEILERVQAVEIDKEIVIVDNCSTDGTREILQELDAENVTVVLQPRNMLKGTSVRTGIERARGDFTIVQDADLEYDPQDYHTLLATAEAQQADAVFGTRFAGADAASGPALHSFGRNRLNDLFRVLYGSRLTDVATCYKLVRTPLLKTLTLHSASFDLDYEIAAKLAKCGARTVETPIRYSPRTAAEGKKLRWSDGFAAAWCLLKYRFVD